MKIMLVSFSLMIVVPGDIYTQSNGKNRIDNITIWADIGTGKNDLLLGTKCLNG